MARNLSSRQGLFDDLTFAQDPVTEEGIPQDNRKRRQGSVQKPETSTREVWQKKMMVKKSVYLTKRNAEALALRHAGTAKTDRAFSKTVNEALERYLAAEIQALEDADKDCMQEEMERYRRALTTLMTNRPK